MQETIRICQIKGHGAGSKRELDIFQLNLRTFRWGVRKWETGAQGWDLALSIMCLQVKIVTLILKESDSAEVEGEPEEHVVRGPSGKCP